MNNDKPVFDYARVSWGDSEEFDLLMMDANAAEKRFDREAYQKASAAIRAVISKCVVSLPRAWLVEGAPATIDWLDGESLRWLRRDRMKEVIQAFRDPEAVAGNSADASS